MFYLIKLLYGQLETVLRNHKDPRVQHLPLVGSPMPMAVIISLYLLFVLHYGPKWMANRKPFHLKQVMRLYNAIQVVANLVLFCLGLGHSYIRKEFSFTCQPVDHTNTEPWMQKLLMATYGYYLTKYLDLLDTVFIILRKKNKQVTFLHVYHHAGMVFAVWVYTCFLAGSHSTMLGAINLLIHSVMYSYYFMTSLRPIKQTLWWKRHITQLQLLQFGYLIIHFIFPLVDKNCTHPPLISFVGLTQNVFMFIMFFDFYYKAYIRKSQKTGRENNENCIEKELNNAELNNVNAHAYSNSNLSVCNNNKTTKCS